MIFIIPAFPWFKLRSILCRIEHYLVLCSILKSLLLYSDVNKFCTFYIIFPYYFFCEHYDKEPAMSSIHNQCITNNCWISSSLIFIFSCVLGVMLFYGKGRLTGQVVMDRNVPWRSYSTVIYASTLVSCSCWIYFLC